MNRNAKRKAAQARRNVLLVVALMLVVCVASIGGTIAWLTDKTEAVTNTFSPSNIMIDLEETGATDEDGDNVFTKDFQLIPGVDLEKDPSVTASSDVDYYVFVKVTASTPWPTWLGYSIDEYWTELTAGEGETLTLAQGVRVYYKALTAGQTVGTKDAETGDFTARQSILANDEVTVSENLTKELMPGADTLPTLSFEAYAIQQENGNDSTFTPVQAWNTVSAN